MKNQQIAFLICSLIVTVTTVNAGEIKPKERGILLSKVSTPTISEPKNPLAGSGPIPITQERKRSYNSCNKSPEFSPETFNSVAFSPSAYWSSLGSMREQQSISPYSPASKR